MASEENVELQNTIEKADKYYLILQGYIFHLRNIKASTFEYTDEIKYKVQDIHAKIKLLKDMLIDLNNKMLNMKYDPYHSITKEQSLQIDQFLYRCCSN